MGAWSRVLGRRDTERAQCLSDAGLPIPLDSLIALSDTEFGFWIRHPTTYSLHLTPFLDKSDTTYRMNLLKAHPSTFLPTYGKESFRYIAPQDPIWEHLLMPLKFDLDAYVRAELMSSTCVLRNNPEALAAAVFIAAKYSSRSALALLVPLLQSAPPLPDILERFGLDAIDFGDA